MSKKIVTEVKKEEVINKKQSKISNFNIWKILSYFIIYSMVGYIIETLFAIVTKGVLESRRSFIIGPFCGIYGIGAIIMILSLQYFKKNKYTLFFGGFLIGSVIEYVASVLGQLILHVKWWDYSDQPFNINGRICIAFSLFWGLLALYLILYFNPKIDKLLFKIKNKLSEKLVKTIIIIITIFMFIDCIITGIGLKIFFTRIVCDYNIDVQYINKESCEKWKNNENPEFKEFANKYFSNEKMLKTFPNLKMVSKEGNIIFARDVLKDIQPYYIMLFKK